MKTKEQAAFERYPNDPDGTHNTHSSFCRSAFGFGVAFAEEWISVEKEVPDYGIFVIAKNSVGYWAKAYRSKGFGWVSRDSELTNSHIVEWRPINRK